MTFTFRQGPAGAALSDDVFVRSALDQPLSLGSTFFDQAVGGILASPGLGTAIRAGQLPEEAPTEEGIVYAPPDGEGETVTAPDTPQMRARIGIVQRSREDSLGLRQETAPELQRRREEAGALTEDAYKASPSFRTDIPWDPGMTKARADALAAQDDVRKVREFYAQKRPVTSFFGSLAGQAVDPINYIPIFGEAVQAAAIARAGAVGGRAIAAAADAAASTAITGLLTAPTRASLGDDVSWQAQVTDIAFGALIGGAFGTIGGVLARRRGSDTPRLEGEAPDTTISPELTRNLDTLQRTQEARVVLNDALDGMIQRGAVELSPASTNFVQTMTAAVNVEAETARLARSLDPAAFERLTTLEPVRASNDAEIASLTARSLDNERLGPTRGAMLEADQLQQRIDEFDQNISRQTSPKQIAALTARRDELRRALREKVAGLDDTLVQEIEDIDASLALRRKVNEPVVAEVSALQARTRELRRQAAQQVRDRVRSGELQAQGPTFRDMQGNDVRGMNVDAPTAPMVDVSAPVVAQPEAVKAAAARVTKPGALPDFAKSMGVDPATGDFAERAELDQIIAEGRVSEEALEDLRAADDDYTTATAWGEALKTAMGCTI